MASKLDAEIKSHQVVMFSWQFCPYCAKAKSLLQPLARDLHVVKIDQIPEGDAISAEIMKRYHHDTVPAIFINGKFVGGCSDIEELNHKGLLKKILE